MNTKNQKKITNIDTPSMEDMRQKVVEQELSARSWKAYYEKMYYSIECEKIEPEYRAYQERTHKRLKEEEEAFKKFKEALSSQDVKEEQLQEVEQ